MMAKFEIATPWDEVKASNIWSVPYQLPTIPARANPWAYTAYSMRIFTGLLRGSELEEYLNALRIYFARCEVKSGFVSMWPDFTGPTSHDELIGAAYLSSQFAKRALTFLTENDGAYTVGEPTLASNIFRFVFVVPFLKAQAGYRVGYLSQALFAAFVFWDAFTTKPGEVNDTLKIWLCLPAMSKYPLSGYALAIWKQRWAGRGFTPKKIFQKFYLTECDVLAKYAKETFE